ncbi:MAG: hypothetical protein DSM106950_45220 [Stigonema ocellatum SAG 48.90 = DSM 106950]|nr:hypothetical protein [Stigonema ocellatum SAG 48.90 = DSM 106950]
MIDGIKLLDVSVSTDALCQHPQLLFPLSLDEQTGAVLNRPRRATTQGLSFTLVPTLKSDALRCELTGSLHRYANGGLHNADDFGVVQLLATLDELISAYGIDPFTSRLNNIEFGVNLQLPFPVRRVLANLISYKYRPFTKEAGEDFAYYQCYTQRYIVKLYDKGTQYRATVPGLPANVLRVEIKVLKMEYLHRQGLDLVWLADLLNVDHYNRLGQLLVDTFNQILFDEPTIDVDRLSARQRDTYQNGRNPKYWLIPPELEGKAYNRFRKGLQRTETAYRCLTEQHRLGADWQAQVASLIGQTWQRLTAVDTVLQSTVLEYLSDWASRNSSGAVTGKCPKLTGSTSRHTSETCPLLTGCNPPNHLKKCPKLTDLATPLPRRETPIGLAKKWPLLTGSETGQLSQINRLSIGLKVDIVGVSTSAPYRARGTPLNRFSLGP